MPKKWKFSVNPWGYRFQLPVILINLAFASCLLAQISGAPPTNGPSQQTNRAEQWRGVYSAAAKTAPPGFSILAPPDDLDNVILAHSLPWAVARQEATNFELEDLGDICKPIGIFRNAAEAGFELLVSSDNLAFIAGGGGGIDTGQVRRIYFNRPHLKDISLLWSGDSVGHWDGDTLVVDTVGFNDQTFLSVGGTRHSEALHVVERWRSVAKGTYLEHVWTVDDPLALASPYTVSRYYKKLAPDTPMDENVCNDTPGTRRVWAEIHNRAVKERQEKEKGVAKPQTK